MYNKSNIRDIFRAFLGAKSYEEMKSIANGRREMMDVVKELKKLAVSDEFIGAYDAEKEFRKQMNSERLAGERDGLSQGLTRGRAEEKFDTARNMLRDKMNISLISKYTGLSNKEISAIRL